MKFKFLFFFLALIILSCDNNKKMESDDTDDMAAIDSIFERNSQTVMKDIRAWESEKPDYSHYSNDFVGLETMLEADKDSFNLQEMKDSDMRILQMWDFKVLTDPLVILPGVNSDTKERDGSVRYYSTWRISRPATDSSSARSVDVKTYSSVDFDEDGKIIYSQMYGDFGGVWNRLMISKDSIAKK